MAIESFPAVPTTTTTSVASPSVTAVSISRMFDSEEKPGPRNAADSSIVRLSTLPAAPAIAIESVLALVAAPQAAGTAPNQISPAAVTWSVASPVGSIVAVTARVPGLYEQVSAAAVAGYDTASTESIAARAARRVRAGRRLGVNVRVRIVRGRYRLLRLSTRGMQQVRSRV